jgi:uncharacterized membrane protein
MKLDSCIPVSVVTVAIMAAASAYAITQLSGAPIPIHWTLDGRVSDYQSPALVLFLLPAVTAVVSLVFAVLPRTAPGGGGLDRSVRPYAVVWLGVIGLMAVLHLTLVGNALGAPFDVVRVTVIASGEFLALVGNYLPKVRYNSLFGVRTPWTLASERVWDRSNRVAGRWLMVAGLIAVAGGALIQDRMLAVMALLIPALAAGLGAIVYSAMISGEEAGTPSRHR